MFESLYHLTNACISKIFSYSFKKYICMSYSLFQNNYIYLTIFTVRIVVTIKIRNEDIVI